MAGYAEKMIWVWIAMFTVLAVVLGRSLYGRGAPRQYAPDDYGRGVLVVTGVSPRPIAADQNNQAFCTISGYIRTEDLTSVEVYRRTVRDFGGRWPEIGDEIPVLFAPGKVERTWFEEPTVINPYSE